MVKNIGLSAIQHYIEKEKRKVATQTVSRMIQLLIENPEKIILSEEPIDKTKLGWDFATEDIERFYEVVLNEDTASNFATDETCSFGNQTFQNHGLYIWMMWGQGMVYTISNRSD
jgi:hypothetical protein